MQVSGSGTFVKYMKMTAETNLQRSHSYPTDTLESVSPSMARHRFPYRGLFGCLPVLMYQHSTVQCHADRQTWGLCRGVPPAAPCSATVLLPGGDLGVCATLGVLGRCTELDAARCH